MGELQAKTGQTENAVKTYRRVLELNLNNSDAASSLKEHVGAYRRLDRPLLTNWPSSFNGNINDFRPISSIGENDIHLYHVVSHVIRIRLIFCI